MNETQSTLPQITEADLVALQAELRALEFQTLKEKLEKFKRKQATSKRRGSVSSENGNSSSDEDETRPNLSPDDNLFCMKISQKDDDTGHFDLGRDLPPLSPFFLMVSQTSFSLRRSPINSVSLPRFSKVLRESRISAPRITFSPAYRLKARRNRDGLPVVESKLGNVTFR